MGAFSSIYIASYVVFRYFSCKPVMFDHTLNLVISKVMFIALVMHQITSVMYYYTEDIFPLDNDHYSKKQISNKNQGPNIGSLLLHKLHQSIPFMIVGGILIILIINYDSVCRIAKKYLFKYFQENYNPVKKPKKFNEIFNLYHLDSKSANTE
jgi:hypothetical protein